MTNSENDNTIPAELTQTEFLKQLEKKYGERDERKKAFAAESQTMVRYFKAVSSRLSKTYRLEKVLAVGGTGIVLTGRHQRFEQPIVVKINRPNALAVQHEAEVLPSLTHPNIITVLDMAILCVHGNGVCDCVEPEKCDHEEECKKVSKLTYLVEPFITGSKPFFSHDPERVADTWLREKTDDLRAKMPDSPQLGKMEDSVNATVHIETLLSVVTKIVSQWTDLLATMHDNRLVYLDVKPENVLVDIHEHLTSIDFGSAERLDAGDHLSIKVYFTKQYAHPELLDRVDVKPSSNRVTSGIPRSELRKAFDYFSLGVSLLEVLDEIARVRPHVVPQLPKYRALHLLATRLLDGWNNRAKDFALAPAIFPGLRHSDYTDFSYDNLWEALRDLNKERGRWNLEAEVPELATYSKDIVRVVPGFNTVLTSRLRNVVAHPLVGRLKYITQLGLVALVYPTADHARFDHALGSYTYTTYYVKALFNDLGNPLFRNLVGREDINTVLLAALLHDLGQYPLAHDLEEVHGGIFLHADIGLDLLEDEEIRDRKNRSLSEVIENTNEGWGVDMNSLRQVLGLHSKNLLKAQSEKSVESNPTDETKLTDEPDSGQTANGHSPSGPSTLPSDTFRQTPLKSTILAAIVDGQIDADKADYIVRDSSRCELPYGAQLDIERLLRVLTVAILPKETKFDRRVALGVYDKGLVSAHALGLARYELLSTVYWHHTARILKCMLQFATTIGLPSAVFGPTSSKRDDAQSSIRTSLLRLIKSLVPPFNLPVDVTLEPKKSEAEGLDMALEPPKNVLKAIETEERYRSTPSKTPKEASPSVWYPGIAWTDWLMLEWIKKLPAADNRSRNLIRGIQTRELYKRVVTLGRRDHVDIAEKLDRLDWTLKLELCEALHNSVYDKISTDWDKIDTVASMTVTDFERLASDNLLIILDVPNSSGKVGYTRPLGVVPELKEKSYQQRSSEAREDKNWRETMSQMVADIAPIRVLCHPDVRNLIGSLYDPVESSIVDLLNEKLKLFK